MLVPTTYEVIDPATVETGCSRRFLAYWHQVRGTRFAPRWQHDFRLEEIGWKHIPDISIVDVLDDGADYRYRFWGTNHTTHKGFEMSGRLLGEHSLEQAKLNGFAQFGEVLWRREPIAIRYVGAYLTFLSPYQITYRFPLSDDGETVDRIVSYQNLSEMTDEWTEFYTHVANPSQPI